MPPADLTPSLTISDIHSMKRDQALEILAQISRVEKKTFPANEAFSFGEELWRKKPNTRVLYVTRAPPTPGDVRPTLLAYAVYVRQKGIALLHKVCVGEAHRRQGVAMRLMNYIRARLQSEGCQQIQLWVDKARSPARSLYVRNGFKERDQIPDYYAPGPVAWALMAFGPSIDRPDPPTPPLYAVERSHKTSPWYFLFKTRVALPVKYPPLSLRGIRTLLRGRGWAGYAPLWTPASHPLQARAFAT
ncbi:acyl-CoA N-acyltransferase [Aspergillus eucalypticola CBS 122712]|uniref:Acyl-CoA N-acyltransferase n=1 Tax=Aspergillus eucalypticola (strain CBS 122712 / IBT 29274) TaxID=1448314 RepID=A0A317V1A1_ASPEC|nr:acyl-CoA N-acyltransferase [Aspergillus eucalypticola CBS 122712]PWY67439.1 acyl-CoA N-acyltransferase [Aspergillus eucalypticola CBS 122712]